MYIEKNGLGHYCLIKDLLKLVKRQITSHKGKMFFCEDCLQCYASEIKFDSHSCSKVLTILSGKNSILKFKNYERKQKINFVLYADFESLLIKL